jgi:hypothetical protein
MLVRNVGVGKRSLVHVIRLEAAHPTTDGKVYECMDGYVRLCTVGMLKPKGYLRIFAMLAMLYCANGKDTRLMYI